MADRVSHIMHGDSLGPLVLELYPTMGCNLHCLYCDIPSSSRVEELETRRLRELVIDACQLQALEVRLLGDGEPFTRRGATLGLMQLVKAHGKYGVVMTNGTLLVPNDIREIIRIGWDELVFSLDSSDKETQDEIRGMRGAFEAATRAMMQLSLLKKASKLPSVRLNTVITRLNFRRLEGLVDLAHELGVDEIYFDSLVFYKEWMRSLALDEEEQLDFLRIAGKLYEKMTRWGIGSNLLSFNRRGGLVKDVISTNVQTTQACYRAWFNMVVMPDGGVKPCCNFHGVVDSVKHKSLLEVWNGKPFKDLRKRALRGLPCQGLCTAPMHETNLKIGELLHEKDNA